MSVFIYFITMDGVINGLLCELTESVVATKVRLRELLGIRRGTIRLIPENGNEWKKNTLRETGVQDQDVVHIVVRSVEPAVTMAPLPQIDGKFISEMTMCSLNNRLYVVGVYYTDNQLYKTIVYKSFCYDDMSNEWHEISTPPIEKRYFCKCFEIENKLYLFGKVECTNESIAMVYDDIEDRWTTLMSPQGEKYLKFSFVQHDCVYMIVFELNKHANNYVLKRYDPSDNTWDTIQKLSGNEILNLTIHQGECVSVGNDVAFCVRAKFSVQKNAIPTFQLCMVQTSKEEQNVTLTPVGLVKPDIGLCYHILCAVEEQTNLMVISSSVERSNETNSFIYNISTRIRRKIALPPSHVLIWDMICINDIIYAKIFDRKENLSGEKSIIRYDVLKDCWF